MSQKNRETRRSARQRMRAQRERDRAREKRRRTLTVAGVAVLVLAVAAGIGLYARGGGAGGTGAGAGANGPVAAPRGAAGKDDLVISVGRADAPRTLSVYEDFRCPACKQFEDLFRGTVNKLERTGRLRTQYHLVTLIDRNLGGSGSLHAANAAACAQDAGRFHAYHDVLYRNQPEETDDAYGADDRLIRLAGRVRGLDTPSFRRCVREGRHQGWVRKSYGAFTTAGYGATPTVLLDGKNVFADRTHPLTPAKLRRQVDAAAAG